MHTNTLSSLTVLLAGQLKTSRTETLEDYLVSRVRSLAVIGITSPFAARNISRCTVYAQGNIRGEFGFTGFQVPRMRWYKQPLLALSFGLYAVSLVRIAIKLKTRFDLFIGVAGFSAFVGILLKRIGVAKKLIYYSIDYYPLPRNLCFNTLAVGLFRIMDAACVRHADVTWHLTPRIAEARCRFMGIAASSYRQVPAPLTYAARIRRFCPFEQIERYAVGFVGTLSQNQGLQLLVEAMPQIANQIPEIKVHVVGSGPYEETIKRLVSAAGLQDRFIFYGFIRDDEAVNNLLARCAVGYACWTSEEDDNVLFADPGKPKLYASLGLPVIITQGPQIAQEIAESESGISIRYDSQELIVAMVRMLKDPVLLRRYKENAYRISEQFESERVFGDVFARTLS